MTAKEFFKGKAFKCIVVLLCVLLFSGAILTIAYGFLAVSDGEKLQRAISSIYSGETVTVYGEGDEVIDDSNPKSLVSETLEIGDAQILAAYKVEVGEAKRISYLVSSKGLHGYGEGTVTCWVALKVDESAKAVTSVEKVTVSANTNQSFISKIGDSTLSYFEGDLKDGGYSTSDDGFITGGATKSSTAICNAVNGAVSYVNTVIFGNSEVNAYADFEYTEYINTQKTTCTVDGTTVKYAVTTKGYGAAGAFVIDISVGSDKTITDYSITTNGSTNGYESNMSSTVNNLVGKSLTDIKSYLTGSDTATINTGATYSNTLCYEAAAFATANYDKALSAGGAN